ncbi:hypothetical protein AMTRI_Chr01g113100 [Amborella trichopoda]
MATTSLLPNPSAIPTFNPTTTKPPPKSTLFSLSLPTSFPSSSSLKLSCNGAVDSSQALEERETIAAAVQAISLAKAAAEAAREAVEATVRVSDGSHELSRRGEFASWECARRRRKKKRKRREDRESAETELSGVLRSVGLFEKSSSSEDYLTRREEAEFSLCLREGARLEGIRRKLREKRGREPSRGQWAEAVGMRESSMERRLGIARECGNRITNSYRRLVVSIATSYPGKGMSLSDLIQEGSLGLLRGAERFDHRRGYKLSTYVYWWIKQAIIKAIATKSRIVRLPGSMCATVAKVSEASGVLMSRLGRRPSQEEIAEKTGIALSRVRLVTERCRLPLSIDQPLGRHGDISLKDIIAGPEETRPEEMVKREWMKGTMEMLLQTLSEREECIVRLQFGMNGETPKSCDEIGRLLNLSRERVRQIHYIALAKLRQQHATQHLRHLYLSK